MALNFTIPMDQTIYADANGYGSVRIVKDSGVSEFVKCYTPDFTDVVKNKQFVCQWVADGNNMPPVVPYPQPTLSEVKAAKIATIDAKTSRLIRSGFAYDGEHFSMSENAQTNWVGLAAANANGMLSFPFPVSTADEGVYVLESEFDFLAFMGACLTYQVDPSAPLASGRALKAQVNACETIAEVDAIVDAR